MIKHVSLIIINKLNFFIETCCSAFVKIEKARKFMKIISLLRLLTNFTRTVERQTSLVCGMKMREVMNNRDAFETMNRNPVLHWRI